MQDVRRARRRKPGVTEIAGESEAGKCHNNSRGECAQLRTIDLNLFRVFDAIMLHRSVREASKMLSITPSAVSHALGRLRQSIGDKLFIPTGSGMQPTRRALELASAVREGLEKLELALIRKDFTPADSRRIFRIGATEYPCMVLLPPLLRRLAKSAPTVDLGVFSANRSDLVRQLEKGRADLVIGSFTELPSGICRSSLLLEDDVITVRTGHPLTRGRVAKEQLLQFPRVVVERTGTMDNATDGFSEDDKSGKRVSLESASSVFQHARIDPDGHAVVSVPTFAAAALFLQLSDMVAILPRRLALWAAAHAPITLLDPPTRRFTMEVEMLWVEGANKDADLRWLRNELADAIGDLG